MKKFATFFTVMAVCLLFQSAKAQSPSLENRAKAAAQECVRPYRAPHCEVRAELVLIADCFFEGTTGYGYDIWVYYHCPPQYISICLPAPPVRAGFVFINCDNQVETVECY